MVVMPFRRLSLWELARHTLLVNLVLGGEGFLQLHYFSFDRIKNNSIMIFFLIVQCFSAKMIHDAALRCQPYADYWIAYPLL